MKILLLVLALCVSCTKHTEQSYESDNYHSYCQNQCKKDYGTDVDWIGSLSGNCYCK